MGEWKPGAVVGGGRYTLGARIGVGGMGEVWAARDGALDRDVALKRLKHDSCDSDADRSEDRKRFMREAKNLASIAHPNVVAIFDTRDDGDVAFIVMEMLAGRPLRGLIAEGPVGWGDAVLLVEQIIRVLVVAHARTVAHRDLKPANVFLLPDWSVKVLDFGLAKKLSAATQDLTSTGEAFNSVAYASPEQLNVGDDVSTSTDMWSLGVVWLELLTGKNPFRGEDVNATLARVLARPLPKLDDVVGADVPAPVSDMLTRLLDRDPTKRPTAEALLDELADVQRPNPHDAHDATQRVRNQTAATRATHARPATRRRSRAPLVLATVGLGAGVVALAVASIRSSVHADASSSSLSSPASRSSSSGQALAPLPSVPAQDANIVALGRYLYHEPALSVDGTVSCETCHPLANGGTTPEPQTHRGVKHEAATFNSPSLWNAPLMYRYSWRADAPTHGAIMQRAFTGAALMANDSTDAMIARVKTDPVVAGRFADAKLDVTYDSVADALDAYIKHVMPGGAAFDASLAPGGAKLAMNAQRGRELFEAYGCVECHQGAGVGGNMVARFGVMVDDPYADRGQCDDKSYCRGDADCAVSGGGACRKPGVVRDADRGVPPTHSGDPPTYQFRVPSLRSVALTDPYFHDGSARTLQRAIVTMARLQLGRELPEKDVSDIEAFLRTLTAQWDGAKEQPLIDAEVRRIVVARGPAR